ncbi:MAG: hypothetical protein JNN32_10780 [Flavobacteriales bacterium]|nr:hypothetical protein [Flavobacteriales bacterium]
MRHPLTLLLLMITVRSLSQGCSDAGVCTAGPIGEIPTDSSAAPDRPHYLRLTGSYAVGEQGTLISQAVAELGVGIGERWGVQLKVPYLTISGNLGTTNGFGDPTFSTSYSFIKGRTRRLDAMLGMKLNVNDANLRDARLRPLPMPYQTSLGTTDILFGANYRIGRWTAALAYQHVWRNENINGFDHSFWMEVPEAQGYFESAALERADDAVARIQYAFTRKDLVVQPGLLAIWHTYEDKRWDPVGSPERSIPIEGSDGLTLNLTADARYKLSDTWSLEASFGSPLITRKVRPDGLTRSMVLNAGLRFAF